MNKLYWIASAVLSLSLLGCEPPEGACVTHNSSSGTHYCFEDERADYCDGDYNPEEFYSGQSCAEAGYPYWCSTSEMAEHGLEGISRYLSNSECNPRIRASGGSYNNGNTESNTDTNACESAWTCAYDGQATPMCQAACIRTGSERAQTCQVLASMLTSGDPSECCPSTCP